MKIAFIAPKSMAQYASEGDFYFLIPQNACEFYAKERKHKMLDNGTYETGKPIDTEDLIRIAREMRVTEIICPDVLFDAKQTLYLTGNFLGSMNPDDKFNYALVPQGKDPEEWLKCYAMMAKWMHGPVTTICVPKWLDAKFHCRAAILRYMRQKSLMIEKPHHLLGLDSIADLLNFSYRSIRSVDTSKPFSYAYAGRLLPLWKDIPGVHRVAFDSPKLTTPCAQAILRKNMEMLKKVAQWNEL